MSAANTSLSLQGKTALVTGSARGIGAAIAWKLATEGADVSDFSIKRTASESVVL
jgi:NAD(P)-dependent dehydrogenase (short-subunit alcohol dehydrogenase family)